MKNTEIRNLSTPELTEKIRVEKEVYLKMKFSHAITPLDNPMDIRYTRKFIARMMFELNKRNKEAVTA